MAESESSVDSKNGDDNNNNNVESSSSHDGEGGVSSGLALCENSKYAKFHWMMRPCEIYADEFKDCTSMRARLHQLFVFGEHIDCDEWRIDKENCLKWRNKKDVAALDDVVKSELKRKVKRQMATYATSSVWEFRSAPPTSEEWSPALPPHMQAKVDASQIEKMTSKKEERCSLM